MKESDIATEKAITNFEKTKEYEKSYFLLRSKGIEDSDAKNILIGCFVTGMLSQQNIIKTELAKRFPKL
jgi:Fe-S cluster assembly scaffold protein SufB